MIALLWSPAFAHGRNPTSGTEHGPGKTGLSRPRNPKFQIQPPPIGTQPADCFFLFLYFLKIKISKIYVHFEIFQKYPPVAPHRATGPKCNFFLQIRNEVPDKKRVCRPAPGVNDRPLSPVGWATSLFFSFLLGTSL